MKKKELFPLTVGDCLLKLQTDSNINLDEITEAFKAVSQLIQEGGEPDD
jgi:hypothetical protein